jgi:ATP-dependent protease ClpP protease subunit
MAKEILLYYPLYSYSVADAIKQMEEAKEDDIVVRVNCIGGEVLTAYGLLAKFKEHAKSKVIKVDGGAASMAAMMLCYVDDSECLDVSTFLFHRAAYPEWIERNPDYFTDGMKASLTAVNGQLRAAMEAKIDVAKFEKITGVTLDELFSLETRIDVELTAKQAKQIKLVNRIVTITPAKQEEIQAMTMRIAAMGTGAKLEQPAPAATTTTTTKKETDMTAAELKDKHPELYAQLVELGAKQERKRIEGLMVFADVDLPAVTAAIESGEEFTPKQMAELTRKSIAKEIKGTVEEGNTQPVATTAPEAPKPAAEKSMEEFLAAAKANRSKSE